MTTEELIHEVMHLRRVLDDIEGYEIDWAVGTGENMARVQNMACAALNRPIPSETAPAAPCETCKGAREVLFLYDRGPGSYPGNQMIPCPTCRPAAPKEGTGGATAGEAKPTECQVQGCGRHVGDCPHGAPR